MSILFLEANSVTVSFGDHVVLDIPSFAIHEGDKIGLVGENGAGKTTFLRVLAGESAPDTGRVTPYRPISYIHQMGNEEKTADAHMSSLFHTLENRSSLSGGENTRRRIAAALSGNPGLLLADEPTTDLDKSGIELLTKQLLSYKGALLLVSHDRDLLNTVCTSIAELRDGGISLFPGNYDAFLEERQRKMDFARFEYDQYRAEQSRLMKTIQGKKEKSDQVKKTPTRMGNSEARLHKRESTDTQKKISKERKALESRLEHLEVKERVRDDPSIRMQLGAASPVTSATVMEIRDFTMQIEKKTLLTSASMRIPKGSRTVLIGDNGCGKTSLLRRIIGGNDPRIRLAPGVKIGLFGQDHADVLDLEKTALENAMSLSLHSTADCRTVLARMGLTENQALSKTALLSGGERAKVSLARLMLADINFLVLDEPTNHLDIYTIESLENLLNTYGGTILMVSHDRSFIRRTANRLVFMENNGLRTFEGSFEEYEDSLNKAVPQEDRSINISVLEMRLAALSLRLSQPKKGDDPAKLNEEYYSLAAQLRELKR